MPVTNWKRLDRTVLREIKTSRGDDSVKRVGFGNQQEFHLRDTTEGEVLVWKRVSLNSPMMKQLEELTGMLGHAVYEKTKKMEKQIKKMKRF